VGQTQRRDAQHPKKLCGFHPAVPGDDLVIVADQDRIGEAEPPDAVGDLPDLLPGMGPGIAPVRPQARDSHSLDSHGFRARFATTDMLFQGH
jgi:hypothetical protein